MPDKSGKLSPEETEKVIKYIADKFPDGLRCSACGKDDWNLEAHAMTPIVMGNDSLNIMGEIMAYPQVAFMCLVCGHTLFFNAVSLGIFPSARQREEAKAAGRGIINTPPEAKNGP